VIASAVASRTEGGWRALDVRVWDGIDIRLLPDRGSDCFGAWYRGVPLAWVSAVGERGPISGLRNVGAPLWSAGATLALDARRTIPRDEDAIEPWDRALDLVPGARERVFEHEVGERAATVDSPATGLRLTPRWDLPRLHQWVHPAPGIAVLGLEPANCSVRGRAFDRAEGRLPVLAPGEERVTSLEISVSRRAA
jgi:hypothetical protein